MPQGNQRFLRFLYFLSLVRWYNVALISFAQIFLAAYMQLMLHAEASKKLALWYFLTDINTYLMVVASAFTIAAAYIINSFYDRDKDLVNRPSHPLMASAIGTKHLANLYIIFNVIGLTFAVVASTKIAAYFLGIQILSWFYSHKLQKIAFLRELTSSLLTVSPVLAVWIHLGLPSIEILGFFTALALIILTKDVLKGLDGHRGNLIFGYRTVAVVTSRNNARLSLIVINLMAFLLFLYLRFWFDWTLAVDSWKYFGDVGLIYLIGFSIGFSLSGSILAYILPLNLVKWAVRWQKLVLIGHVSGIVALIVYKYILIYLPL
jgi:4-hydroxybenzoate polyprenyltransferase